MYAQPQSLLPNFVSGNADRLLHATMGKLTGGLSPAALVQRLDGLGDAPRHLPQQAGGDRGDGRPAVGAPRPPADACAGRQVRALHRAPAAGPALPRPGLGPVALQRGLPELPPGPAVAVDLHARRARHDPAPRAGDGLHHAAGDGLLLALQLPVHQPGSDEDHPGDQRREPGPGLPQLAGGHGALHPGRAAGRGRELRGRQEPRDHARQGGAAERPDRADPVHAHHPARARRAPPHGAGVDHEVLHPRPLARQLAGEVPRGQGAHGVHDLVEEPGARGPQPLHGRLPAPRRDGGRGRGVEDRAQAQDARAGLLPGRHAAVDRRGGDGARRRQAVRLDDAAGGADGLHGARASSRSSSTTARSPSSRTRCGRRATSTPRRCRAPSSC